MTPDPLQDIWTSQEKTTKENVMNSIQLILDEDEAARKKEQRANLISAPFQVALLPVLLWCAAFGKTPLVRAGYALMATGIAIGLFALWVFTNWSRQAEPGPIDAQSQLRKAAYLLSRQASLAKSSPLWASPVFIGGALIGLWAFRERGLAEAAAVWSVFGLAWGFLTVTCLKKAKAVEEKRAKMEELLSDLGSPSIR